MNMLTYPSTIKGFFKIEAVKPDGSRRVLADWFPNLVTDNGLDLVGSSSSWMSTCVVGSGNTAPANSDTQLVSLVGSTTNVVTSTQGTAVGSPYYGFTTNTYRFAAGVATGNLTEVGVGATSTNLFSRALILDGIGNPTTITVLSVEALDVTYQLRNYAPLVDVTGNITISAVVYAYQIRAANVTGSQWNMVGFGFADTAGLSSMTVFDGALGAITSSPSGSSASGGIAANNAYSTGTHRVDGTFTMGLTVGNLGTGISAALITTGAIYGQFGGYQISFTPAIPKDNTKVLTLGFRQSWARH